MLSALSNSACLLDESFGYLVFGVKDESHEIVGTDFCCKTHKKGGEELEMSKWDYKIPQPSLYQSRVVDKTSGRLSRERSQDMVQKRMPDCR